MQTKSFFIIEKTKKYGKCPALTVYQQSWAFAVLYRQLKPKVPIFDYLYELSKHDFNKN